MIIDLHVHSHYSPDGYHSIPELLNIFQAGDIVGITDHETIAGWGVFEGEAKRRGIIPVLGVEWFSGDNHVLSYFIDGASQEFVNFMSERRRTDKHCMRALYDIFKEKYPMLADYDEILAYKPHPEEVLGLPALAEALSKATKCSRDAAVRTIRSEKGKMKVRPRFFSLEEIVKHICSWKGFPVLAHPYRNPAAVKGRKTTEEVQQLVSELVLYGIKGLDVYSWESSKEEFDYLCYLCKENNLLPIIGSDYHYATKGLDPSELKKFSRIIKERIIEWLGMKV